MSKMKEPGLFRQIIAIHYEQAKRRKALRLLAKQEWSLEFLTEVLVHSAKVLGKDVTIELETKGGNKMTLSSVKGRNDQLAADNDIFNHLDDEAAVQSFINRHGRRGG